MKLKHLESLLEDVEAFRTPNQALEQYPTGAHLAACVVHAAHARGHIQGRAVADLGVGGG
jgi:putative methylase